MTTKYTIEVEVDDRWIEGVMEEWRKVGGGDDTDEAEWIQIRMEIATTGTGISVYTVYKTEE